MFFGRNINKRIDAYQSDLMNKHYEEVENMYRQVRGWRHDYRNHIQTMMTLMKSGEYEKVMSYLETLGEDLNTVDTVLKTGNIMADAILNSKISLAKSNHIQVDATASIPVKLSMTDIDLCVIIGNLLDNAIEASMTLPEKERMIRIYIEMKKNRLYLSFTNLTAAKKMKKENGIFRSTKGAARGFGLLRVDRIVKKYGGYLRRASEDGAFTTEILLPQ
ncbi:MAG: GHKL domain-containing protein [Clostridia bacterium]|nr:GHKL domain-containing protein [Clostridia bacterium]